MKKLSLIWLSILLVTISTSHVFAFEAFKEKFGGIFQKGIPSKLDKLEKATQALNYNNSKLNEAIKLFNNSLSEVEIALRAAMQKYAPRLQDELNQLYAKGDGLVELTQLASKVEKEKNIKDLEDLHSIISKSRDHVVQLLDTIRYKISNATGEEKNIVQYLITFGKIILSKYELMIKQMPSQPKLTVLNVDAISREVLNNLIYFILTGKDKGTPADIFLPAKPNDQVEIKKAYRRLLLQWHSDKLTDARKAEIKMKLQQKGYSIDEHNVLKLATAIIQFINEAYEPYK